MQTELWKKVLAFDFDQPLTSFGFSTRVARENFWTRNFTANAILEYKKFMYLAATSDLMVSPSPIIDKVWHEHLMFSKSYRAFCEVLGKDIQHVPATHNRSEFEKFRAARERTINLYTSTFGDQPEDIWKYESMYESLNLPKANINLRTFINYGLLAFPVLLVPAYFLLSPLYVKINNPAFGIGYFIISMICLIVMSSWNRRKLNDILVNASGSSFVFDLDPMEVKFMETQDIKKVVNGRLNLMLTADKLKINDKHTLTLKNDLQPENLEEWEVHEAFEKTGNSGRYYAVMKQLEYAPVFTNIANCMDALKKFVMKSKSFGFIFYTNFVVLGVLLLFGFTRLATGIIRDKPIGMLLTFLIILVALSAWQLHRLTRKMVKGIIPDYYKKTIAPKYQDDDWLWRYVLYDSTVLVPNLVLLDSDFHRGATGSSNSSGSSCGSSDSSSSGPSCGSSCGSSCGGCGGGD